MIYTENFKMSLKDIGKQNKIKNRAILLKNNQLPNTR